MRILMLVAHPDIRGPMPKHTPWLVAALRDLGCQVTLLPWGRRPNSETFHRKIIRLLVDIKNVQKTLSNKNYDVLVVKTSHDWATLGRDIPLLLIVHHYYPSIVLQFHGSWPLRQFTPAYPFFVMATKWMVSLSKGGLLLSTEEMREWQDCCPGARFQVVKNPLIPFFDLSILNKRRIANPPDDPPVLLFVGRIIEAKGIFDLLQAFSDVSKRIPCRLNIVGDGKDMPRARVLVEDLGIDALVTFSGWLDENELHLAYRDADIFVFPSWREGFSFSILEAMDAGLPIITTKIRGMADNLQESKNVLFILPHDVPALTGAMISLLSDPILRERMAVNNREKIKEFAPDLVAAQYLNALKEIIG